ncbi:TlpA family protein disulfide reductase [Neiella sp. HB171785]|uniref:TlpA family protein disulfide reductase n=1 Tax=Neiella litorisoli TaxID=2771431 RepID=A0A8J6QGL6_9GAMM|nr:TlpA disulfide reductase family protein [Neiella litorisoli]MBD1389574.1 TlpA family protein disulfide reductase [Neiella litorisoli]
MKKLIETLGSIAIVLVIFIAIQWYREQPMLALGHQLSASGPLPLLTDEGVTLARSPFHANERQKLLYFFAPWCGVCRISMPAVDALAEAHPDVDIVAIALSYQDDAEVRQFISELGLSLPVYLGNQNIQSQFQITVYPSYYLVSEQLRIIERGVGYSTQMGLSLMLDE